MSIQRNICNQIVVCLLLATLTNCVSCDNNRNTQGSKAPVTVSLDPAKSEFTHTDVLEILEWIDIEADDDAFIGYVKKIERCDSSFYILDITQQKCVLRYSSDGRLLSKIGVIGNGRGEYPAIYDFTIDKNRQKVYVLSASSDVYIYGVDGTFEKKCRLNDNFISNISFNDDVLVATSGFATVTTQEEGYLLYTFDKALKQTGAWFKFSTGKLPPYSTLSNLPLVTVEKNTYFTDIAEMKILRYNALEKEASVFMECTTYNPMPDDIFGDVMKFIDNQREYNWLKDAIFGKNIMLIGYVCNGEYIVSIMDYEGHQLLKGIYLGPLPACYCTEDDCFYSTIPTDQYLQYWERQKGIKKPNFAVTGETNMLVMKWRLKDNLIIPSQKEK